jgi:hypothetical protein
MINRKWTRAMAVLPMAAGLSLMGGLTTGCAKQTGSVAMRFSGYTVAKAGPENRMAPARAVAQESAPMRALEGLLNFLMPPAKASISEVQMCFKRLRFKQEGEETSANPADDPDNVDLKLGLVTLDAAGTGLSTVNVANGTYTRIEFDLEDGCGTGYSLQVNNLGLYSTTDGITIRFQGTFNVDTGSQSLAMSIQSIIDALTPVTSGSALRAAAEGVSGSL